MRLKHLIILLFLAWGLLPGAMALAAPALPAAAYNPLGKVCSNGGESSATCNSQNTNRVVGPDGIIARVTRVVALIGAVIAVIVIIIYGFQMIASYGDSAKVTTARNAVLAALIGLVIIALAQAIVVFLINNI